LYSYQKQHPEIKRDEAEFEDWYETDNQRELHQIFSGQSQIVDSVKSLTQKLDEVVGRQERTLGLLSNVQSTLAVSGSLNRNAQGDNLNKIINYLSIYVYYNII